MTTTTTTTRAPSSTQMLSRALLVVREDDGDNDLEVIATATQLFGLHEKIVNVSLRLAKIHLRNYYSSNAMQALRAAARRIADSLYILNILSSTADPTDKERYNQDWLGHDQLQYIWLWEHCDILCGRWIVERSWACGCR
jgi:hypothetical protein